MYPVKELNFDNESVARLLEDISTAYFLLKKNRFRTISYQNAAAAISTYPNNIFEDWTKDPKTLDTIPGVGEAILKKIDYFFQHHKIYPPTKKILDTFPPALYTFTRINGIGPKIAKKLTSNFDFPTSSHQAIDQLIKLSQEHKLRDLPQMGQKAEEQILNNTLDFLQRQQKMSLSVAQKYASEIISYMKLEFPDIVFEPLGSLRRQAPQVGDIDIAARSDNSTKILNHFVSYPHKTRIVARGEKKASIKIDHDIRVDLMVQPPDTFGSLLQHFTGSKDHNIKLRQYALSMGYSLSEYGIKEISSGKIHNFTNEDDFYHFLGLNYIPPEKRLGGDEIEQAKIENKQPTLSR